jgi:hypothetical protein
MSTFLARLAGPTRQYLLITGNYWAFTLTDGALRMLVLLHFNSIGYSALQIAMLFLFYEVFGVLTNLFGGWLGARLGLNYTMNLGLALQIIALAMLLLPAQFLSVLWIMSAQGISGIAKDLNKMSAKSAIKLLVPSDAQSQLYVWIARLTGSKNALKGLGFFCGGLLLSLTSFQGAIGLMLVLLIAVWLLSLFRLEQNLGKSKQQQKFKQLFAKSRAINYLSAARLLLFAARDVWFVVALPVYLATQFQLEFWTIGSFLALWIIAYGGMQMLAPYITGIKQGKIPNSNSATYWAGYLVLIPSLMAIGLSFEFYAKFVLLVGLLLFALVFAVNSSIHSFLIVSYANQDGVSLDIGFYYMANAMGRLIGTLLSGWVFQLHGFTACLWLSAILIFCSALMARKI